MKFGIATLMIILTTVIHTGAMFLSMAIVHRVHAPTNWHIYRVSIVVLVMAMAGLVETIAWASAFVGLGAIDGFEQALYFSIVTYTTLGYGDIVLADNWRLLAAFSSINGIIMFGWSTAIVFASVQINWFPHGPPNVDSRAEHDS